MRNTILATLALSSLVSARTADACGIPEPVIYRLSSHAIFDGESNTEHTRTFALFAERAPASLVWRMLSPMSYDSTRIADAAAFSNPVTLTLVGPSGTRVVSSSKHVFLSRSWDFKAETGAIEVTEKGDFAIALWGEHDDAKWRATSSAQTSKALVAWARTQGMDATASELFANRIGDVETVSRWTDDGRTLTAVRRGAKNIGRFDGSPLGMLTIDGFTYLVLADGANVRSVLL